MHRNNCDDTNKCDNSMDYVKSKAGNYMLQGNYLRAEKAYRKLLGRVEEHLAGQEVERIAVLNCLSEAYRRQGKRNI